MLSGISEGSSLRISEIALSCNQSKGGRDRVFLTVMEITREMEKKKSFSSPF